MQYGSLTAADARIVAAQAADSSEAGQEGEGECTGMCAEGVHNHDKLAAESNLLTKYQKDSTGLV